MSENTAYHLYQELFGIFWKIVERRNINVEKLGEKSYVKFLTYLSASEKKLCPCLASLRDYSEYTYQGFFKTKKKTGRGLIIFDYYTLKRVFYFFAQKFGIIPDRLASYEKFLNIVEKKYPKHRKKFPIRPDKVRKYKGDYSAKDFYVKKIKTKAKKKVKTIAHVNSEKKLKKEVKNKPPKKKVLTKKKTKTINVIKLTTTKRKRRNEWQSQRRWSEEKTEKPKKIFKIVESKNFVHYCGDYVRAIEKGQAVWSSRLAYSQKFIQIKDAIFFTYNIFYKFVVENNIKNEYEYLRKRKLIRRKEARQFYPENPESVYMKKIF